MALLCLVLLVGGLPDGAEATEPLNRVIGEAGNWRSEPDTVLFAVVVRTIAEEAGRSLRVDPRPLRSDPGLGLFVDPGDFAPVSREWVDARAATLARLGIEAFRRSLVDGCGDGPDGTPPAIGPADTALLRAWMNQPSPPTCVFVGLPRREGVYYPPAGIDRRSETDPVQRTVRAVMIGPGQATDVFDVVVRQDAKGRWRVRERVRLAALRS